MPEEDKTELRTRDELLARIAVSMGGRAAEEVVLHTMTNGAAQDIQDATSIARNMVAMYGMSDRFGMMALASKRSQYLDGGYGMDCAQDTAAALDEAVRGILDQCYATAVQILQDSRADMDKVVAYLLEKETITGSEMVAIIQGRDPAEADSPFLEGGSAPSAETGAPPAAEASAPAEAQVVPQEAPAEEALPQPGEEEDAPEEDAEIPPQAEPAEGPQDRENETE
jgi:cell division protease FtsH